MPSLLRFGFVVSAEGILQLVISKTSGWATQSGKIMFAKRFPSLQSAYYWILNNLFYPSVFTHSVGYEEAVRRNCRRMLPHSPAGLPLETRLEIWTNLAF